MDPESKKLLDDTFLLVKDNNIMLHKIRRGQKWASIMRIVYWLIIIGASIEAFYYLQPYVEKLMTLYNQVSGSSQTINKVDLNSIEDILKNYKITPK